MLFLKSKILTKKKFIRAVISPRRISSARPRFIFLESLTLSIICWTIVFITKEWTLRLKMYLFRFIILLFISQNVQNVTKWYFSFQIKVIIMILCLFWSWLNKTVTKIWSTDASLNEILKRQFGFVCFKNS